MGLVPMVIATLCYVWTAFDLAVVQKNWPMALTFACYAAANCGLIYVAYKPQIQALLWTP